MRLFWLAFLALSFCTAAYGDGLQVPGIVPNAQGQVPSMVGGVAPSTILISNAAQTIASTSDVSCFSATALGAPGLNTIPANGPYAGNTYHIWCQGTLTTPAITPGTLTVKIKWGATTVVSVTTASLTASATNLPFTLDEICTIQSSGTNGTMSCGGSFSYAAALTGLAFLNNGMTTTSPVTINTTTSSKLDATLAFSTVAGSQTATGTVGLIEVLY